MKFKTAISRPLEFSYQSNRFIVRLIIVSFVVNLFIHFVFIGDKIFDGLFFPIFDSLLVFSIWALSREIDPDNNKLASLASLVTFILSLFLISNAAESLTIFWLVIALRLLVCPVGINPTNLDLLIFTLYSAGLSLLYQCPEILLLNIFVVLTNFVFNKKNKLALIFILFPLVFTIFFDLNRNKDINLNVPIFSFWLFYLTSIFLNRKIECLCDNKLKFNLKKVFLGRFFVALFSALVFFIFKIEFFSIALLVVLSIFCLFSFLKILKV